MKHALLVTWQVAMQMGSFDMCLDADRLAVSFYQMHGLHAAGGRPNPGAFADVFAAQCDCVTET